MSLPAFYDPYFYGVKLIVLFIGKGGMALLLFIRLCFIGVKPAPCTRWDLPFHKSIILIEQTAIGGATPMASIIEGTFFSEAPSTFAKREGGIASPLFITP